MRTWPEGSLKNEAKHCQGGQWLLSGQKQICQQRLLDKLEPGAILGLLIVVLTIGKALIHLASDFADSVHFAESYFIDPIFIIGSFWSVC